MQFFKLFENVYSLLRKFEFVLSLCIFTVFHAFPHPYGHFGKDFVASSTVTISFFGLLFILISVVVGENDSKSHRITEMVYNVTVCSFNLASGTIAFVTMKDSGLKCSYAILVEVTSQLLLAYLLIVHTIALGCLSSKKKTTKHPAKLSAQALSKSSSKGLTKPAAKRSVKSQCFKAPNEDIIF